MFIFPYILIKIKKYIIIVVVVLWKLWKTIMSLGNSYIVPVDNSVDNLWKTLWTTLSKAQLLIRTKPTVVSLSWNVSLFID